MNQADFDLLGIGFKDMFFIDKCLPMGCVMFCNLFEKFSTFLQWCVEERCGLHSTGHYLDYFIFIGAKSTNHCGILMNTFHTVCQELGVPIAENKTSRPATVITYLGFVIDTVLMMVLIPQKIF